MESPAFNARSQRAPGFGRILGEPVAPRPQASGAGRILPLLLVLGAMALGGCASFGSSPRAAQTAAVPAEGIGLRPFSSGSLSGPDGAGWSRVAWHPTKPPTQYRLVQDAGVSVVEAVSDASVSGLSHPVNLPLQADTTVTWRWKVDALLPGADVGDRHADDSPARLVLAFGGDTSALPLREQMLRERVKLLTGQDLPYATLMYVWDNERPVGTVVKSPHTDQLRKLVVESGAAGVGQWRTYRRNIAADFALAFGEPAGRLKSVGVMTDADNTRQKARCLYGDVSLK